MRVGSVTFGRMVIATEWKYFNELSLINSLVLHNDVWLIGIIPVPRLSNVATARFEALL